MINEVLSPFLFFFKRKGTVLLALAVMLSGCTYGGRISQPEPVQDVQKKSFTRDFGAIDFSGVKYTPWDVAAAVSKAGTHDQRAYTIMIYMNGSDIESEEAAATLDMMEMLDSGVDTELVNVVIFTGGTYRWHNDAVPADDCVIWRLEADGLSEMAAVGLRNMGDAGTLSSFISFGMKAFPAERYGLIFWDHGGGSIAGYGHDEHFNDSTMTLLEMEYAFSQSGLGRRKLEFIGFDACLMATVEMAVVASGYARYLIASQDLEPGDGWDYSFLGALNGDAALDGAALGRVIADSYMVFYSRGTTESLTISVIDLSRAVDVMGAMGALMSRCSRSLLENEPGAFTALARRRYRTKTFGGGTRRGNSCDMVDIGDMAGRLRDIFPDEAEHLRQTLGDAVILNRHNSLTALSGLTAYYIYGGKDDAEHALGTYSSLNMSGEYTDYLMTFAGIITNDGGGMDGDEPLDTQLTLWNEVGGRMCMVGQREAGDTAGNGLWPVINGKYICMYRIGESSRGAEYAVPVRQNGEDADLIIMFGGECPNGKILGTRREDVYIIQKGVDHLRDGDEIAFCYKAADPGEDAYDRWVLSDSLTVSGSLELEWKEPETGSRTRLYSRDVRLGERFGDFEPAFLPKINTPA